MANSEPQFVFVIGAARSGTKFLRDTLAAHPDVFAVPYDVNFIWRLGNEGHPHDELAPEQIDARSAQKIRKALRRAAKIPVGHPGMVLEKTVSNTLRVEFVDRVFPHARYIHLVRDGRRVVESAARMWEAPPDPAYLLAKLRVFPLRSVRYGGWFAANLARGAWQRRMGGRSARALWGPRYAGIVEDATRLDTLALAARQWCASVRRARQGLARIEPARVHQVRYEALVADEAALGGVCEFLRLADPGPVLERYRATVKRGGQDGWQRLDPAAQAQVVTLLAPQLAALGYAGAAER